MSDPIVGHKVVLLGETAVGKSCLSVRFTKGEFTRQEATLAGAFHESVHACVVALG
jgi:GTPase SAR1 family protein